MADEKETEEKQFTFMISKGGAEPEKVVKKESELDRFEKEYLYGNLINAFNNNTAENQERFIQSILEEIPNPTIHLPPTSEA